MKNMCGINYSALSGLFFLAKPRYRASPCINIFRPFRAKEEMKISPERAKYPKRWTKSIARKRRITSPERAEEETRTSLERENFLIKE
jgi:hypothetical protein